MRILVGIVFAVLLVPMGEAQLASTSLGGESSCSSLTMTCRYRIVGFHTGLPGAVGVSGWGASHGACVITAASCMSQGQWATAPYGSCYPAYGWTPGGEPVVASWCAP